MKPEITAKEYINIYQACGWDPKAFSIVLKRFGYSDELIVLGNLDLRKTPIKSLVNVKEVDGYLDLTRTPIEDLGNLKEVGLTLDLEGTFIQDLGGLKEVGGDLWIARTPIVKKYSIKEISKMVKVRGSMWWG